MQQKKPFPIAFGILVLIGFSVLRFYLSLDKVKPKAPVSISKTFKIIVVPANSEKETLKENRLSTKIKKPEGRGVYIPRKKNNDNNATLASSSDELKRESVSNKENVVGSHASTNEINRKEALVDESSINDTKASRPLINKPDDVFTVSDSDAGLRLNKALKIMKSGDTLSAMEQMRDIAKGNRKYIAVWHHLTLGYLAQGNKASAIKSLNKLLKLSNSERIKKKINEILKLSKDEKFDTALKKLKDLKPDDY